LKLRSYFRSASFEKKQAGNSPERVWYAKHSQHLPRREHEYVHGQGIDLLFAQDMSISLSVVF
ncbi:MAG: hypothetical protein FWG71_11550, partial [Synergistaceae bacterium]|nr:hypothetical protein [Synergistaceae bacterium]